MKTYTLFLILVIWTAICSGKRLGRNGNKNRQLEDGADEKELLEKEFENIKVVSLPSSDKKKKKRDEKKAIRLCDKNDKDCRPPCSIRGNCDKYLGTSLLPIRQPCCCACSSLPCKCKCDSPMANRAGYIKIGDIKGESKNEEDEEAARRKKAAAAKKEERRKKAATKAEERRKRAAAKEAERRKKAATRREERRKQAAAAKKQEREEDRAKRIKEKLQEDAVKEKCRRCKRTGDCPKDFCTKYVDLEEKLAQEPKEKTKEEEPEEKQEDEEPEEKEEPATRRHLCVGEDEDCDKDAYAEALPPPCEGDDCEIKESKVIAELDDQVILPPYNASSLLMCCCDCTTFPCACQCNDTEEDEPEAIPLTKIENPEKMVAAGADPIPDTAVEEAKEP